MGRVYVAMAHGIGLGSMFLQTPCLSDPDGTKNYYFNHFGVENDAAAGHTLLLIFLQLVISSHPLCPVQTILEVMMIWS
ncbi:hypothetical protein NC652_038382 [Populus alba x Populus x berolinensis]|nr:hypothetical protein NC652_038382 [Populus alba x Populus x berolinensis]